MKSNNLVISSWYASSLIYINVLILGSRIHTIFSSSSEILFPVFSVKKFILTDCTLSPVINEVSNLTFCGVPSLAAPNPLLSVLTRWLWCRCFALLSVLAEPVVLAGSSWRFFLGVSSPVLRDELFVS